MPKELEIMLGEDGLPDRRYRLADLINQKPVSNDNIAKIVNEQRELRETMKNKFPKINLGDVKVKLGYDKLTFRWGDDKTDVNLNLHLNGDKSFMLNRKF